MDERSISVLGCGWMGLPLARHLVRLGFSVKGSSTQRDRFSLFKEAKISPFWLTANPQVEGERVDDFFKSRILFLSIPFRRDLQDPSYYKEQIDSVITFVKASPVEFVIFAGSTSIYPDSIKEALEDGPTAQDCPRAKVLKKIEQELLGQKAFRTTVVRFAGLYGGSRQIGRLLAGRKSLPDGKAPVNLIHLDDCVGIVTCIIESDVRGEIFNACSDGHPAREDIYVKAAKHYGLTPPQFSDGPQIRRKVVSNEKVKKMLGYTFKHPDPLIFNG